LAVDVAVAEAKVLESAGFSAVIIENFGDTPFRKDQVSPETVASMAVIARAVREAVSIPMGVNVLRNDALSALAIAATAGCEFIRVNVLSGVAATDQGWIEGQAATVLAARERLDPSVRILADVWVKHAKTFSSDSLTHAIEETAFRAGADGVILTGPTTGRMVAHEGLEEALSICRTSDIPLYLGSGISSSALTSLPWQDLSGVIVGSALRQGGKAGAPLDRTRVRDYLKPLRPPVSKRGRRI
jgi:membrane complex biogenesis BtpA family protein